MGLALVLGGKLLFAGISQVMPVGIAYLLMLILVGLLFQTSHPGRKESCLCARPVSAGQILLSRWCFAVVLLLLPFYLSQLLPLLWVDRSTGALAAFTLHYWGVHFGLVAVLGAVATASEKMYSYVLRCFFGGALLLALADTMRRYSWREANWIYVKSPEAAQLLLEVGLSLAGLLIFAPIMWAQYRGRASWRLAVVGLMGAITLAAAWKPVKFLTDVSLVGHAMSEQVVDLEGLTITVERQSQHSSYTVQRNQGDTSRSTYAQSVPPYWKNGAEEFWFMRGRFEIEGLDPTLTYSARLLEARWISESGDVVIYDPPLRTHFIRNHGYTAPAPPVTSARMTELLGEPPTRPQYFHPVTGQTEVLLFGAWTSIYKRYQSTPGRLELRVRVDFYRHELSQRIALAEQGGGLSASSRYHLQGYAQTGDEFEARLMYFTPKQMWERPIEQRWSHISRNWWLYDSNSGQRAPAMGIRASGVSFSQSLSCRYIEPSFKENGSRWHLPDLTQPERLELLHIEPRYLGTSVVDVTTEDFALVTPETIERAERNEL
ncbi:hypothetical protein [Thalassobacterium maritimum]|nr:hypothetical protein [Coraliomargarita sp. SDUM461003]